MHFRCLVPLLAGEPVGSRVLRPGRPVPAGGGQHPQGRRANQQCIQPPPPGRGARRSLPRGPRLAGCQPDSGLPILRERIDDVGLLAQSLLESARQSMQRQPRYRKSGSRSMTIYTCHAWTDKNCRFFPALSWSEQWQQVQQVSYSEHVKYKI